MGDRVVAASRAAPRGNGVATSQGIPRADRRVQRRRRRDWRGGEEGDGAGGTNFPVGYRRGSRRLEDWRNASTFPSRMPTRAPRWSTSTCAAWRWRRTWMCARSRRAWMDTAATTSPTCAQRRLRRRHETDAAKIVQETPSRRSARCPRRRWRRARHGGRVARGAQAHLAQRQ